MFYEEPTVMLLSGGVDSVVAAHMLHTKGLLKACVFVDYGHPAQAIEGWHAFAWCGRMGVQLKTIHAFGLELGDMAGNDSSSLRIVPARNAILCSMAANYAISIGSGVVAIGANKADRLYPDCSGGFMHFIGLSLGVKVCSPVLNMTKAQILSYAEKNGIFDYWSCYEAGPEPCGKCSSCTHLEKAKKGKR